MDSLQIPFEQNWEKYVEKIVSYGPSIIIVRRGHGLH
jgi:hypothetical protein